MKPVLGGCAPAGRPRCWFQIPCLMFLKLALVPAPHLPEALTSACDLGAERSAAGPWYP